MDEDFGDLVAEGDLAEMASEARPASTSAEAPKKDRTIAPDLSSMPTERELKLALEVQELRRLIEIKDAKIALLEAVGQPAGNSASDVKMDEPFEIPPQLTATLSILKEHVAELTRDNDALRNTFLPHQRASSRRGMVPNPGLLQGEVAMGESGLDARNSAAAHMEEVDLEGVLRYVKDLIRENEDLGAMVMEAGKTDQAEWQAALDESRAVIHSLDADLEHHLEVIQRLQAELAEYRASAEERKSKDGSKPANTESKGQGRSREGDDRHRGSRHGEQRARHEPARGSGSQTYPARDARPPKDRVEQHKSGQSMSILAAATSSGRLPSNDGSHASNLPPSVRGSDRNDPFRHQHGHRRADSRDARDTRPPSAARGLSDRDPKRRR